MAKVSIECPGCFAKLNLPDRSKLGKKIKCPKCAEIFVAETPDDDDTEILDEDDAPAKSLNRRKRPTAGGGKKPSKKSGGSRGWRKTTVCVLFHTAGTQQSAWPRICN